MEHISHNEAETEALAAEIATDLNFEKPLFLYGNLGVGKSVFARALIRTLVGDLDLEVPSPTFTLVQSYAYPEGIIHHFDLYRLKDPGEIYELGWEEALADGPVIVEWPERLGAFKPSRTLDIHFESGENEPSMRKIRVIDYERDHP